MQSEKHLNLAVLFYILSLLLFVIFKMVDSITVIDLLYLVVLSCCILKFFLVMKK